MNDYLLNMISCLMIIRPPSRSTQASPSEGWQHDTQGENFFSPVVAKFSLEPGPCAFGYGFGAGGSRRVDARLGGLGLDRRACIRCRQVMVCDVSNGVVRRCVSHLVMVCVVGNGFGGRRRLSMGGLNCFT